MSSDRFARLAGLVAFGVLGFYLELPKPVADLLAKPWDGFVLPIAMALFGAVATPYISTRPAGQLRSRARCIMWMPASILWVWLRRASKARVPALGWRVTAAP